MSAPRTIRLDQLVPSDCGHVVRFLPTDIKVETDLFVEAVMIDYRRVRLGFEFRLKAPSIYAAEFGVDERKWQGPMKPWQKVQVLGKPGEVSVGDNASSALADRLDPALLDAPRSMQQPGGSLK